jgi:hypothetical protein
MLVTTSAPIVEENSNANGKRQKSGRGKRASEIFKQGYSRVREAGALPVIENLLGLSPSGQNQGGQNFTPPPPPPPPPPTGMSNTTKIVVGVVVLGAVIGAVYYFTKVKGKKTTVKK